MGGCCGFICGYTSKVINVAENSRTIPVELSSNDAGNGLTVSCRPAQTKCKADVSVVGSLKPEANQGPVTRSIQGELSLGPSYCRVQEAALARFAYEIAEILGDGRCIFL